MKDVVIVLLIAVLIFFIFSDSKYTKTDPIMIADTVYQQKTFTKFIKGKSIPFVVLDTIYLIDTTTVYKTDTIISDYIRVYAYSDTIKLDTLGFAYIQDTISRNSIIGRSFIAQIKEKVIYKTIINDRQSKNQLYLGFIGDLSHDNGRIGIGGSIAFKTAKNTLFTANATMNGYSFGYYKKF